MGIIKYSWNELFWLAAFIIGFYLIYIKEFELFVYSFISIISILGIGQLRSRIFDLENELISSKTGSTKK